MKNILHTFLIFLIIGCSSSNQENKLIGKWYTAKNNKITAEFQFYKDSLVIYDVFKKTLKWDVKGDEIHSYYLQEKGPTYKYQLDEKNEILNLELIGQKGFKLPEFKKAKNAFDFFEKTIDLKIELPKSNVKLKNVSQHNDLNFNIYVGFKENNLVVKTDLSTDLNNLDREVEYFEENTRDELKPFLRFNLIADKNIADSQIDSIKNRLNKTSIKTIFRTYKNMEINYIETINWFGVIEKN